MEKQIKISNQRSYGRDRYFPACELSAFICKLIEKKTLPKSAIALFEKAGYAVEITNNSKE